MGSIPDCRIAVLITVHNRKDKTVKCLDCLNVCYLPQRTVLEIYLTDDGCCDGTTDAVREKYPEIQMIQGNGTLFWNRGMWTAWNEAAKEDYDFYLWLNDDTFLYPYALEKLISESTSNDDKAIIIGATGNRDITAITYGGYVNGKRQIPQGTSIDVEYFNGNLVLIPRYVYERLGNLDYHYRHSKGDFDYGRRAQKAGIRMILVGEVLGICESHDTLDKWCNPDISLWNRIQNLYSPTGMPPFEFFYFDRKHHGLLKASVHFCSIHMRCLFPQFWIGEKKYE